MTKPLASLVAISLPFLLSATEIPSGPVSGAWPAAGNPYLVQGDIFVPPGQTLQIHPGVQVIFQGHYTLEVSGGAVLEAAGTPGDSVTFTSADTVAGWGGIRFDHAGEASRLTYCRLFHGKGDDHTLGGALRCADSDLHLTHSRLEHNQAGHGGAVYFRGNETYRAVIADNSFAHNFANAGLAVHCAGGAEVQFTGNAVFDHAMETEFLINGGVVDITGCRSFIAENNLITHNRELAGDLLYGGGLYVLQSQGRIVNNLITSNIFSGLGCSGGICLVASRVEVANNTFAGNSRGITVVGLQPRAVTVTNCIIQFNDGPIINYNPSDPWPVVTYTNLRDVYPGEGNIDADPQFVAGYHLAQTAAGQPLQSPCVDAGAPGWPMIPGTTRTDGAQDYGLVDMGYHYPLPVAAPEGATLAGAEPRSLGDADAVSVSPNPFNPVTVARFELRDARHVTLRVYDTAGREVATLVEGWREAGVHEVTFDASALPSGIYFARLSSDGLTQVQKLILLK
ncbi:MAG: T9SS C-terminal target domain-containing protein [Candidatus Zixiibacteriota bacterium]|nr:MAG: T9SS C-terminal target domain-containing protein [candidate division Zixibacteria bacterium]